MRLFLYNLWFMLAAISDCGLWAIFTLLWKTYRSNSVLRRFFMPIDYLVAAVFFGQVCAIIRSYNIEMAGIGDIGTAFGIFGYLVEAVTVWLVFMMLLARVTGPTEVVAVDVHSQQGETNQSL